MLAFHGSKWMQLLMKNQSVYLKWFALILWKIAPILCPNITSNKQTMVRWFLSLWSCLNICNGLIIYLCLRCASRSQRGMLSEQLDVSGQVTNNLSSSLCTKMLERRQTCSCRCARSSGQKSRSCRKLRRQRAQKVWPHGVSRGWTNGWRQMWHTKSSSTSNR